MAASALEQTPPTIEEDDLLAPSDPTLVAKAKLRRNTDGMHFIQSNLKLYFELDVFKEEGECLKETLVVRQ